MKILGDPASIEFMLKGKNIEMSVAKRSWLKGGQMIHTLHQLANFRAASKEQSNPQQVQL
jgi:hypothetical protein